MSLIETCGLFCVLTLWLLLSKCSCFSTSTTVGETTGTPTTLPPTTLSPTPVATPGTTTETPTTTTTTPATTTTTPIPTTQFPCDANCLECETGYPSICTACASDYFRNPLSDVAWGGLHFMNSDNSTTSDVPPDITTSTSTTTITTTPAPTPIQTTTSEAATSTAPTTDTPTTAGLPEPEFNCTKTCNDGYYGNLTTSNCTKCDDIGGRNCTGTGIGNCLVCYDTSFGPCDGVCSDNCDGDHPPGGGMADWHIALIVVIPLLFVIGSLVVAYIVWRKRKPGSSSREPPPTIDEINRPQSHSNGPNRNHSGGEPYYGNQDIIELFPKLSSNPQNSGKLSGKSTSDTAPLQYVYETDVEKHPTPQPAAVSAKVAVGVTSSSEGVTPPPRWNKKGSREQTKTVYVNEEVINAQQNKPADSKKKYINQDALEQLKREEDEPYMPMTSEREQQENKYSNLADRTYHNVPPPVYQNPTLHEH